MTARSLINIVMVPNLNRGSHHHHHHHSTSSSTGYTTTRTALLDEADMKASEITSNATLKEAKHAVLDGNWDDVAALAKQVGQCMVYLKGWSVYELGMHHLLSDMEMGCKYI